jgi:hypothetical protein
MVLRTVLARGALGGLGIVAVLFTPTSPRLDPGPDPNPSDTVLASTLAPGDHAGVLRRVVRFDPEVPSPEPAAPASIIAVGAMAAVVLEAARLRLRRRVERPASPGPVLLRAPTRSPPFLPVAT